MRKHYILLFALFLCFSCQQEEEIAPQTEGNPEVVANGAGEEVEGHVRIKLTEEAAAQMETATTRSGGTESGISQLDALNRQLGTYRMVRTFRPAGKFEERHRKAGLHRWYDLYFDKMVSTRSAASNLSNIPGIEKVEGVPVATVDYQIVPEYLQVINKLSLMAANAARSVWTKADGDELPFNDPRLSEQWHYNNTGQVSPWAEGADVNLFDAWQNETGDPSVIVAVIDEGVQYNHPDLSDNMWVNEAELNGQPGVDDDNNGYVDDVYGYNFVVVDEEEVGTISPMTHGTHVSGTIAAVNGNSIGVCGIAGGTADEPGVRIMALQMMDGTNGANTPDAFVYAADNGAVITQNSWTSGYDVSYDSYIDAIDYFIENAGISLTGEQTGPMAGGVVIFAAANDNTNRLAFPASLDQVVAVSAFAPDLTKATYSNYGDWVDIAAPGGQTSLGSTHGILSTDVGNNYAWLQGTSMACPHVSGVAALIVSKFGGIGYTADQLKEHLLSSVQPIDDYNPEYAGQLGVGYTDAGLAVQPQGDPIAPESTELQIVASFDGYAIVEWTVAADEDDGHASRYVLEWRNVNNEEESGSNTYSMLFAQAGDVARDTIEGLTVGATYSYTLTGYDRWNNAAAPSTVKAEVGENLSPVLTAGWSGNAFVDEAATLVLPFTVSDPEGHAMTYTLTPQPEWMTISAEGGNLSVTLAPGYGDYTTAVKEVTLTVMDEFGATVTATIPYKVVRKTIAPQLVQAIPDQTFTELYRETRLSLADYFQELHGDAMIYEIENSNTAVCFAQSNGTNLTLRPESAGYTTILVRAINQDGLSVSCRFRVDVKP